jgi:phytoene synthase
MSINACAGIVERGDPERFRAAMAAPVSARPVLFALYAFNIEVSRAPWVTKETMIAEMRLQWWRDALDEISEGQTVRRHEVVDALADVLDPEGARCLDGIIAARRWDIYSDAFEDADHLHDYIDATSGHLTWTAARLLGAADQGVVRDFAYGVGVANFLRAVPALEERGRKPLVDGTQAGVRALAKRALKKMDHATANRRNVSNNAAPALIVGWQARPALQLAARDPAAVAAERLSPSAFRDAARLVKITTFGWWR